MNSDPQRTFRRRRRIALAAAFVLMVFPLVVSGETPGATTPPADRHANRPLIRAGAGSDGAAAAAQGPSATRVVVSLGAVAVMIVGLGWAYRRLFAAHQQKAGSGAVTLVSRSLLTPRHQVLVMRVGHRLVLIGDSGHGMNRLGEITDPGEVAAVLGEASGGVELETLRGDAFRAALDGAVNEFSIPGHDSDPVEIMPAGGCDVQGEVRSLIDRVRGLAGHMGGPAKAEASSTGH